MLFRAARLVGLTVALVGASPLRVAADATDAARDLVARLVPGQTIQVQPRSHRPHPGRAKTPLGRVKSPARQTRGLSETISDIIK